MADPTIKSIFDEALAHLKIDVKLLKKIRDYGQSFVNRNPDHVAFFGGNLLGVYPIRFRNTDRSEWYDGVLELDDVAVRNRIAELPTLDPEWKRGTDVMNLSCLWLVHAIYHSNLPQRVKDQGMIDVLMVLHYKLITSIMSHYFKYPADTSVALATYAALSKKFSLKVHGSWSALLYSRCEDIIDSRHGIHHKTIENFIPDESIQYMITDIQGRLRNIVKKMWIVFDTVRTQDAKILSSKMTGFSVDGEQIVRDMKRNFSPYKRYIHDVVSDPTLFIKDELINVVSSAMPTMAEPLLLETLQYMSRNYRHDGGQIEKLLDETLLHAFDYLSSERSAFSRSMDMGVLISKLRAIYMASRGNDEALKKMRELGESIASKAVKSRNPAVIASIRTGVLLYIVLRTFGMKHYG